MPILFTRQTESGLGTLLITSLLCFSALATQSSWAADSLHLQWTNNMLTVMGPSVPGGKIEIWYLEAFCRRGSTGRDWNQTTLHHKTELLAANPTGASLRLRTPPCSANWKRTSRGRASRAWSCRSS